jgi:Zn-dependent M28 family amino/carboxypeptidase
MVRSTGGGSAAPAIDTARLGEHIRAVSADDFEGRRPATPGEQKTVDYIVAQLRAVGVEPGGDRDAGGMRMWTQTVPLAQSEIAGPVTAAFHVRGETTALAQGEQIAIRATQQPTTAVSVKDVPVIFLGYGVRAPERQWDDFKGADVRGKIGIVLVNDPDFEADLGGRFGGKAMTYYGRWTYKYEEAARQGMLGLLVVHEDAPASYGWATVRNSNNTTLDVVRPDAAAAHPLVEGWLHRDATTALFASAGLDFDAEKKQAQSDGFQPVPLPGVTFSIEYPVKQTQVTTRNVLGILPGRERPDETVFYTAHWDHLGVGEPDATGDRIYNGARDNGSGIAALLELARVFAAAERPERSVVFLFVTAEESGLLGSLYYGENPIYPLATTVAVFNMDDVGGLGPARDISVRGGGQVSLEDDVEEAARAQGRRLSADPRPEAGSFYRSDHFSFARVGVPAISIRSGEDLVAGGVEAGRKAADDYNATRYHQPADEWRDDWDLNGLAADAELVHTLGRGLADSSRWPEWKDNSEFKAAREASADARR